jgi:hypothetical protein
MRGMFETHVTEHHLAQNSVYAGLRLQACQIVTNGGRRTGNAVTDALERAEIAWVDFLQDKIHACTAPKVLDSFAPARIGGARNYLCFVVSVGDNDMPGNSDARERITVAAEFHFAIASLIPARGRRSQRRHSRRGAASNRVCVRRAVQAADAGATGFICTT